MLTYFGNNEDDSSIIKKFNGFVITDKIEGFSNNNVDKDYIPSDNNNVNGYIKENLLKNNLTYYPKKALIIDELNNDEEKINFNACKETWTSNDLRTDIKQNATVEEFKTILIGYDFINIRAHGYININGNPTVCLQEKQHFFEDDKYSEDIKEKRVGTTYGFFGGNFYLTSSFFSHYYSNELTDKIVLLGCCNSYNNDTLVSALANQCKAKAVIAPTDNTYISYNSIMADVFVHKLLFGHTVDEALKEAKLKFGNNDEDFITMMGYKSDNTPSELKVYNGGDEKLVELVRINNNGTLSGIITDENGNPIKGAEIGIHNIRGMSYGITATTNENGEYTLECPQDSYKIGVKADGYEVFETDDFVNVVYGEETIYNITLKKEIEPTANYTAVDLIDKTLPEIISLMNGEYQIIKTESDIYNYIQNQSVFPGMEFYIQVSGDDIISANNGEEIHSNKLEAKLESGELTLDGIQVNKSGKVSKTIQTDMDYKSCSKALGD